MWNELLNKQLYIYAIDNSHIEEFQINIKQTRFDYSNAGQVQFCLVSRIFNTKIANSNSNCLHVSSIWIEIIHK